MRLTTNFKKHLNKLKMRQFWSGGVLRKRKNPVKDKYSDMTIKPYANDISFGIVYEQQLTYYRLRQCHKL